MCNRDTSKQYCSLILANLDGSSIVTKAGQKAFRRKLFSRGLLCHKFLFSGRKAGLKETF